MANQIVVSAGAKVRNLSGVLTATSGVVSFLPIDVSMGIPQLDVNGKILVSQLPNSVMEYKGTWNAATNTPTLVNGTGNQGDVYLCNVAGTVNFGAGAIAFFVGDQVIYSGSIWQRASGATGTVTSVAVTETGDSLNITGSPITTSGTINIGFNGTNLQYVNGAGNLTTFPVLTGYVPYTGATQDVDLGAFSLNGKSLHIKGTAGNGHLGLKHQSAAATGSANESLIYADSLGDLSWQNANLYLSKFITSANTANRSYTFPNANGTVALTSDISYPVTSVFGRTGAVVATEGDYSLTQLSDVTITSPSSGQVLKYNGTAWINNSDTDTGITSLNGLTALTQTFAVGTSGTDFNISSATSTHTFNIPDASASARGLVTTGTQTFAGAKTLTGALNGTSATFSSSAYFATTSGSVGIGTILPINTLSVGSNNQFGVLGNFISFNAEVNANSDGWINFQGYNAGYTQFRDLKIGNGRGSQIAIFQGSTGSLGIGTSSPAYLLDVNGTARVSGAVTFSSNLTIGTYMGNGGALASTVGFLGAYSGSGSTYEQFLSQFTLQSTTTSNSGSFRSNISTTASAFTLTNLKHFEAQFNNLGTGSAITNHYGFYANSSLSNAAATNTYGFFGDIASYTNRWNLYMAGTAANYLAGVLNIGTTTLAGYALDVNGTGRFAASYTASGTVAIETWQRVGGAVSADMTYNDANTSMNFGTSTSHSLNIKTNNTTALTISSTGAATFSSSVTATSLIKSGGTSAQYLMADGSTSTLTNPVTGTGTTNYLPKFTGASTIGNSLVRDDGSGVSIGIAPQTDKLFIYNASGTNTGLTIQQDGTGDIIRLNGNGGANRLVLQQGGNLGLGVTPSAWGTTQKAIDVNGAAIMGASGLNAYFTANCYYNAGWFYKATYQAAAYGQENGSHIWYQAASGTAGNAITFTQAMTLTAAGYLGIGTASPVSFFSIGTYGSAGKYIDSSTLPTTPSNYLITLAPPSTTGYYGGGIGWSEGSNTAAGINAYDDGAGGALGLSFATGTNSGLTERMRITSAGIVQLNASDATYIAYQYLGTTKAFIGVAGTSTDIVSGAAAGDLAIRAQQKMQFATGGDTPRMTITSTGNVLIGTTTDGGYKLDVNGTGRFSGGDASNPTLKIQAPIYPLIDLIVDNADTNARNWRLAGVYNAYGTFQILSSTTQGGVPTTSRFSINGVTGAATFNSTLGIGGVADSVKGGTYTPTINTTTNIASSSVGTWQYLRVGNTVTVSGSITITPTSGVTTTSFNFSLPINSTFATGNDCAGTGVDYNATTYLMVNGNSGAANFGLGLFKSTTTSAMTLSIQFTYQII